MYRAVRMYSFLMALCTLCWLPPFANAGPMIFTDRAAFQSAAQDLNTITFENIAPPVEFVTEPVPPGLTLSGVNFSIDQSNGNNGTLYVLGPDFYYPGNSVLSSQGSTVGDNNIIITLPFGVSALGLDYGSFFGDDLIFTFSDGTEVLKFAPTLNEGLAFLGIVSPVPITSLSISAPTEEVLNIDNVSFSTPTAAPEPSSLVILIAGSPFLLLVARRLRYCLHP
jgi:hypothetical protein